jgi:hypothetical protein
VASTYSFSTPIRTTTWRSVSRSATFLPNLRSTGSTARARTPSGARRSSKPRLSPSSVYASTFARRHCRW